MERKLLTIALSTVTAFILAACAAPAPAAPTAVPTNTPEPTVAPTETPAPKDIVEVASAADNFKTLVAAVQAAGLVETLKGEGPFTVFAPTDEAFAKLGKETLDDLLKPENKDKLVAILTYHVVPGKVTSDKVVKLKHAKTVQGETIAIKVKGKRVFVNDAEVIATDIEASNGVIHVIDAVILPPSFKKKL